MTELERLLAPNELAELLGVPLATLRKWRFEGVGPAGIRVGKHVRYKPSVVSAWLTALSDPTPGNGRRGAPSSTTENATGRRRSRAP